MLLSWQNGLSYSLSPVILFVIQLGLTHLLYVCYLRHITPSVASGSAVMALGIFVTDTLLKLNPPFFILQLCAYEIVIIWLYLALMLVHAGFEGQLSFQNMTNRLALGTWVAATVIVVMALDETRSNWHGLIALLGIIAVFLYLIYLSVIGHRLLILVSKNWHLPASGLLLLSTVSTQAIVMLLSDLFHDHIAIEYYQGLILLGYIFYVIALFEIIRYTIYARHAHWIATWPNTNTIIFGAMSITGFAIINSQTFPEWVVIATWWWSVLMFFINETIEICRLIIRIKKQGIVKAVCCYRTSQWARVFTFAMLYAFAVAYYNYEYPPNHLTTLITGYGQYIVTALVVIELILAVGFSIRERE